MIKLNTFFKLRLLLGLCSGLMDIFMIWCEASIHKGDLQIYKKIKDASELFKQSPWDI